MESATQQVDRDGYIIMAVLLVVSLALRWLLLGDRWINPDEGAHLMDARLVLDGYIPVVDYSSRQVAYVFLSALVLKLTGISYMAARFFPLLATVVSGWIVFLVGRRLFGARVAWIASTLFLLSPFCLVLSLNYKTQPLSILLSLSAVYIVVRLTQNRPSFLGAFLVGMLLATGFYVRQSSLALLLALPVYIVFVHWSNPTRALRCLIGIGAGFVATVAAVFAFYLQYLSADRIIGSSLDPLAFVWQTLGRLLSDTTPAVPTEAIGADPTSTARPQAWGITLSNVGEAVRLNLVFLVASVFSVTFLVGRARTSQNRARLKRLFLLYLWLAALTIAYGLFAAVRGFFPAYLLEFMPALALLTAAVAVDSVSALSGKTPSWRDLAFVGLLVGLTWASHLPGLGGPLHRPFYFTLSTAAVAVMYLSKGVILRRGVTAIGGSFLATGAVVMLASLLPLWVRLAAYALLAFFVFMILLHFTDATTRGKPRRAFVTYSLVMTGAVLTVSASLTELDARYDGVWSPQTVDEVVDFLTDERTEHERMGLDFSPPRVVSGAVIWELEAGLIPYRLLSHPLILRVALSASALSDLERDLGLDPPEYVILDGYTQLTYIDRVPMFSQLLKTRYTKKAVVRGSRYPVSVYTLNKP